MKHITNGVDGIAEDMIRSIVQLSCSELHQKTLYEKYTAELENGLIDTDNQEVIDSQIEKIEEALEDLNELAQLRRRAMLTLFNLYDGDKSYWCQIKHLGAAAYCLMECYLASDDDAEILTLAMDANRAFTRAMSHFIGVEITDCSSCLSDFLKGKNNEQTIFMRR